MSINFPGNLHTHTDYSNLRLRDSINTYDDTINYALELGHEVIAFTEHETVANAVKIEKYYNKIKKINPNFKVILGNEIYLCRNELNAQNFNRGVDSFFHFILLAKDAIGHKQIRELSTRAWSHAWLEGKMFRVPTYYSDIEEIIGKEPGHVIGSTACLGGYLAKIIMAEYNSKEDMSTTIISWLNKMKNIFGENHFYLEMQPANSDEQKIVNAKIVQLSQACNIPTIITTDAHYLKKEDRPIHEAFLRAQEGDREVESFYATTYLMNSKELEGYLTELDTDIIQQSYQNILTIKNMCEDYSLLKPLKIPSLKWRDSQITSLSTKFDYYLKQIPYLKTFYLSDFNGDRHLVKLIIEKLESDPRLQTKEIYDELNSNLETTWISSEVNNAHWSAYFLNLQKTIDICWEAGTLVGPGRGSGVGFLLLYILDIIQINPVWETTKTFSWRFLNPERVSVLDIDTDIEGGRRAQVLQALRDYYGKDKVSNVVTFGTEAPKSAIQTAARGLGIDNDIALHISSLVPADRGISRTLSQCYYGDIENDFQPVSLFVQYMNEYPKLWEVAQKIEGLICRVGEHAGGVIFVDEPFVNSTALMKVPNGDIVTQFDLHDCEDCSLIKIDLLSIESLDKIHTCLDLLEEYKYIEKSNTLRDTYEKYLGIYNIERNNEDMWKMVWRHEIQALFQMEKQSGIQGIALTLPKSVDDLAVLNSVIRLMAQDKNAESPLNKYARYKKDIGLWYKEMAQYGLTKEEQQLLEPIVKQSYGICESQEKFMQLVQIPECGGFDLNWADRLRKSIAKKNPAEYDKLTTEYFQKTKDKGLSYNLCNYVWNVLVATSRGYGFNASHTLAYSLIGLQEMNLAYKFPIIFWNCACLITDSGGNEEDPEEIKEEVVDIYEPEDFEEFEYIDAPDRKTKIKKKRVKTTDYKKTASAIGKMTQAGIKVIPPDINTSTYTFRPDVENNQIIYGLSGMLNVGEDIIKETIANRPYTSPKDYLLRVKPKKQAMISLIKSGAFDSMMDRKLCMGWYIWEICDKKQNLNLNNLAGLIKYKLIPKEGEFLLPLKVYEFNRYLKAITKADPCKYKDYYTLDDRALAFLQEIDCDELLTTDNLAWFLPIKKWDKVYQGYMDFFRKWISNNKEKLLKQLNDLIFQEQWEKYATGSISAWEMETICYYYHEHELANINKGKYGIVDFYSLPEEPIVDKTFEKGKVTITMYKLFKICGTCIAKNKDKGYVTLLTPSGVVNVKFRKEYFSIFDKQISEKDLDGTKKIKEKSWFNRGSMIMVQGIRQGDNFIAKKYNSVGGHQLYRITEIDENGDIKLQTERYQSNDEI